MNVLFDEGFRDKNVTVDLRGVTFQEALDQITFVNRLFYKVLDQNTIIIVDRVAAKRRAYDAMLLQTFYLQNAETKDVETLIKTGDGHHGPRGLQPDPRRHHRHRHRRTRSRWWRGCWT